MLLALQAPVSPWEKEVIYQIFPRSFADSNGDKIGDFKGIQNKLGYIKKLGATAILLQPILKSRVYHNYFPDSYTEADPRFGSNSDFFDLVHAAHRAGLKVVLDMEPQYVAGDHPWYIAANANPTGPDADRLAGSGLMGLRTVPEYDGTKVPLATVDTNNSDVVKGITDCFLYWSSPPDRPDDGVDGFRLDHMMDDLDNRHINKDMLSRFWAPLEAAVKAKKPNTFFVAEQSDWGLGNDQFAKGNVDAVYAIPLRFVFLKALIGAPPKEKPYQPGELVKAYREELASTPEGKTQLIFTENHDIARYASEVKSDPDLLRLGAVFMLTAKGTPSIYYGQELGMTGTQLHGHDDGNDIPIRLAMPWTNSPSTTGTATWYPPSYAQPQTVSVGTEDYDRNSLLNFYRKLIRLRRTNPALSIGSEDASRTTDTLIDLTRQSGRQTIRILINLAPNPIQLTDPAAQKDLWTAHKTGPTIAIPGHGFRIVEESR